MVQCPKAVEGEHFAGLEMLTQLLTPRGDTEVRTGVEELGGEGEEQEEEEEEEWYFEQQLPEGEEEAPSLGGQGYGFGFRHSAAYSRLLAEFGELVDVPAVDGLTYRERDAAREAAEFSADHYLADLYSEDGGVEESLAWAAPAAAFTREEQERLVALPRRQALALPLHLHEPPPPPWSGAVCGGPSPTATTAASPPLCGATWWRCWRPAPSPPSRPSSTSPPHSPTPPAIASSTSCT